MTRMISKAITLLLLLLTASAAVAAESASDTHHRAGIKAFSAEDYLKAAEELDASLKLHPDAKTALYLGNAYLKLGQLGKAKAALERALQIDPDNPRRDGIVKLIQGIESRNVGVVQISSTPPGATIYVQENEAKPRGKAPIELSLSPGTHRLIGELEGFASTTAEVTVQFGESTKLELVMRARDCELALTATPPGGRAAVDSAEAVLLPAKVRVVHGEHKVTFAAAGFRTQVLPVTCDGTAPLKLNAALAALPPPQPVVQTGIALGANVPDAALFIDEKPLAIGKTAELPAGLHTLRASAAGYRPLSQSLQISDSEILRGEVQLRRRTWHALGAAIALTALAITAESVALVAHSQAGGDVPDSAAYHTHQSTEVAMHVTAGVLAAGAIVGYVLEFTLGHSSVALRDRQRPARVGTTLRLGSTLMLAGQF